MHRWGFPTRAHIPAEPETTGPAAPARQLPPADSVYLKPPVETVDEAVERMEAIAEYIATHELEPDGLGAFNYLYTVITRRIRDGINEGFFDDRAFLTQLDVCFANRYFDALRVYVLDQHNAPHVWQGLLDRRAITRIRPIQFAVAGVNAHINYDLAVAVVDTCSILRTEPRASTQKADYQKVNQIFAEEMADLRRHYETSMERVIDGAASPILNLVCNWSVVATRAVAWEAAERLWKLRRAGSPETMFVAKLDRFATLSGEVLLTPII